MEWNPKKLFDLSENWCPPSSGKEREKEFDLIREKIFGFLGGNGWLDRSCLLGEDGADRTIGVWIEPFDLPEIYNVSGVDTLFKIVREGQDFNLWRILLGWGDAPFSYLALCSEGWSTFSDGGRFPETRDLLEVELQRMVDRYALQFAYSEKYWALERSIVRRRFLGKEEKNGKALVIRYINRIPFVGEAMGNVHASAGIFDLLAECFSVWAFFPCKDTFDMREGLDLEWEEGEKNEFFFRAYVRSGEDEDSEIPEDFPGDRCGVIFLPYPILSKKEKDIIFFPSRERYVDIKGKEGVVFNFVFEKKDDIREVFVLKKGKEVYRVPVDFNVVTIDLDFRPDNSGFPNL